MAQYVTITSDKRKLPALLLCLLGFLGLADCTVFTSEKSEQASSGCSPADSAALGQSLISSASSWAASGITPAHRCGSDTA